MSRVLTPEQRELARERNRRYAARHPEKVASAVRRWQERNAAKLQAAREANRAKKRAYDAQYNIKNAERKRAYTRQWAKENPERKRLADAAYHASIDKIAERERLAKWRAENPGRKKVHENNRRERTKGSKLSPDLPDRLLKLQRGLCACCRVSLGSKYHLDHIMPLSRGGSNTDSNIQLLCPPCNMQKKAKHPIDFMQQRGYLL